MTQPTDAPRPEDPKKPRRVQIGAQPQGSRPPDQPQPGGAYGPALEAAMDAAMDEALTVTPKRPSDKPLKKQWDEDLEAELQAAMEGFDSGSFDVNRGRNRPDRSFVPKSERGQEGRPGHRIGKMIGVRGTNVFVDLGGKSEGVIPVQQFEELQKPIPDKGELLEVVVDRFDPSEGIIKLVLKGATIDATWETLRKGAVVEARVTSVNKGGVDVEVGGIRGFLPISQIDLSRVEDASTYLNQKFRVVVTEANERLRNLVVSRKELMLKEREEQAAKTWTELEEGQIREGTVRSIQDFGAFVDIGGVDGLVHVSDISWQRVKDVRSLLAIGQQVQVKVLKIDREGKKLGLGLKQLLASPWDDIDENYPVGRVVPGTVTKLMDFGAFVELEPGVEGLVHISELGDNRVRRVSDILKAGQEVDVKVVRIDREARKLSLSVKQAVAAAKAAAAQPEPEEEEETPPAPKPERKIPLKGGLGGGGPLFALPGEAPGPESS